MIQSLRPVFASLALRTLFLWIVVRLVFAGLSGAAAASMPEPFAGDGSVRGLMTLTPPSALFLAGVVALLVLSDVRALRERALLANMGVGLRMVAATAFSISLVCEALVGAVLGVTA